VNQEKDPADSKEQNEKWKLENEKESPLKKSEKDVVDPQKPLCPQNLNGALRENVQLVRITKTNYAMQGRVCQCNYSKAQRADS